MVILRVLFIIFVFLLPVESYGDDAQVSASISAEKAFENYPLTGIISVTHNPNDVIDISSFTLNGKSLDAELFKTVQLSPTLVISFFNFTISGQAKGIYTLPPISVKVGKQVYQSLASSYEILGAVKPPPNTVSTQTSNAKLELKASVDGPNPLYPGQEVNFIYRYYFRGDIELSEEKLPLLDATGFQKIGDKVINDSQEGDMVVQEFSQKAKALSPGEYQFPASSAAGFAYVQDPILKTRTYLQPKLTAEVAPITVTVSPFPTEGSPSTFNGAVGPFTFQVSLLTAPKVNVDEKMQIAIDISSDTAQLSTISLPDLNQPGIKGVFRLGDLPPTRQVTDHTVRFVADLYPLLANVTEIPSIAFSYFDPNTSQYVTLQSQPIPITVVSGSIVPAQKQAQTPPVVKEVPPPPPTPTTPLPQPPQNLLTPIPEPTPQKPQPIEIEGNVDLNENSMKQLTFGTWDGLFLIPAGLFLIAFQVYLRKRMLLQRSIVKPETSVDLWRKLQNTSQDSPEWHRLLERTLLTHLVEINEIPTANIAPDALPTTGEAGKVKVFLQHIEEMRFASNAKLPKQQLLDKAKDLMKL